MKKLALVSALLAASGVFAGATSVNAFGITASLMARESSHAQCPN